MAPSFSTTIGSTTADGEITWKTIAQTGATPSKTLTHGAVYNSGDKVIHTFGSGPSTTVWLEATSTWLEATSTSKVVSGRVNDKTYNVGDLAQHGGNWLRSVGQVIRAGIKDIDNVIPHTAVSSDTAPSCPGSASTAQDGGIIWAYGIPSGRSEPTWSATTGTAVKDAGLTWNMITCPSPLPDKWKKETHYKIGDQVRSTDSSKCARLNESLPAAENLESRGDKQPYANGDVVKVTGGSTTCKLCDFDL